MESPERLLSALQKRDSASDCAPDNHSWTIVYEGASPEANQPCDCGARTWNSEGEWCRTGKRSRPSTPSVPANDTDK